MIPMLMRLVIMEDRRKKINLRLPLFLIWIICLPLFLLIGLIWALTWLLSRGSRLSRIFQYGFQVLFNLRDLQGDLQGEFRGKENCFILHF